MNYNLYERKDTPISQKELDWIDKNLDEISKQENVLFIFQCEHEAVVVTNKHIYFPKRKSLISIEYCQVNKMKIGGDFYIEITHKNLKKYTLVLASPIDKVKLFFVLKLLIKNERKKLETSFEDVEKLFDEFTVIKFPPNQDQHKLPQVYLKELS